MAHTPSIRFLLIDRSSRAQVRTHPDVAALLDKGWKIIRLEPRVTEGHGAQWLVALTNAHTVPATPALEQDAVPTAA